MSILFLLIPLSLVLVAFGLWAFFWAVNKGQFDDLDTAAWSVLQEEESPSESVGLLGTGPLGTGRN